MSTKYYHIIFRFCVLIIMVCLAGPASGQEGEPPGEYMENRIIINPEDPRFTELWGMHNTGQNGGTPDVDIDAPEAWDITTGDPVIIDIIDSGIDYNHEDLAVNIRHNNDEFPGDAGKERGVQSAVKYLDKAAVVGKQYLFLIGINKYKKWPPLKNPVKDIKEIRDILLTHYYIDEVFELHDEQATKSNIIKTFKNLQSVLEIHDSLLVIYTGHGHLDKSANTGFWIPVNAGTDSNAQANWLPNVQIKGFIANMKSITIDIIDNVYFSKAYSKVSRQVLTSGALEMVPDDSQFARALKLGLKKNTKAYLDTLMLFNEIRLGVTKTSPLLGSLKDTGHQEGASFLLFKRQDDSKDKETTETAVKTGDDKEDHTIEDTSVNIITNDSDITEQETVQRFFSFQKKLISSDIANGDNFGHSVSISGDFVIVGAYREDGGEGDPMYDAGAAYIFHRTETNTWDVGTRIVASDPQAGDRFGYSVSISGDYAIVGALRESGGAESPLLWAGAAYVFE